MSKYLKCLKQTDISRTQLRALLRASIYGNLSVMYAMTTAVWEVERIHDILEDVCKELDTEGIPYQIPVAPSMVLRVRQCVREMNVDE